MRGTRTSLLGGKPALARDLRTTSRVVGGQTRYRISETGNGGCAQSRNLLQLRAGLRSLAFELSCGHCHVDNCWSQAIAVRAILKLPRSPRATRS